MRRIAVPGGGDRAIVRAIAPADSRGRGGGGKAGGRAEERGPCPPWAGRLRPLRAIPSHRRGRTDSNPASSGSLRGVGLLGDRAGSDPAWPRAGRVAGALEARVATYIAESPNALKGLCRVVDRVQIGKPLKILSSGGTRSNPAVRRGLVFL